MGTSRALALLAIVAVAALCGCASSDGGDATPTPLPAPTATPDPCASHCENGLIDLYCEETGQDCGGPCSPCSHVFDFKDVLFDPPRTLAVSVDSVDADTGVVQLRSLHFPETSQSDDIAWGDGDVTSVQGSASHTYTDRSRNYIVRVVSNYADGSQMMARGLVRFVGPSFDARSLSPDLQVTIPDHTAYPTCRMYSLPPGLTYFDDSFFTELRRGQAEYVLTVAATLQYRFANQDVYLVNNGFRQLVLRYPPAGGMFSMWFTSPVAFGCGNYGFTGTPAYSSFFHEMGHNVTLNSPAGYYYGGRIDGNANAIYSETMAQLFQHATTYTLLNGDTYGLSEDLLWDVEQDSLATMGIVRRFYDEYLEKGQPYTSWNDPSTPDDEAIWTFMTIAYKFFEQAENRETGYEEPLERLMRLLQTFDADLRARYDQANNTHNANVFRSTLMVAAVSYAFDADLRGEFRALSFPVDDATYEALLARP